MKIQKKKVLFEDDRKKHGINRTPSEKSRKIKNSSLYWRTVERTDEFLIALVV